LDVTDTHTILSNNTTKELSSILCLVFRKFSILAASGILCILSFYGVAHSLWFLPETDTNEQTEDNFATNSVTLSAGFRVVPTIAAGGASGLSGSDASLHANLSMNYGEDTYHEHAPRGIDSYTVQPGDTLTQIAEDYRVSTNTIRWENGISGNKLTVGKELVILPVSGVRHKIQRGDTFGSISKKYRVDIEDVLIYNQLSADTKLTIGEKIMVPNGVIVNTAARSKTIAKNTRGISRSGYYTKPTNGPLTSGYGPRWGGYHYGDDYGVPVGTSINASASGVVTRARIGWSGGYGNYIIVKHANGTETLYAHLSKILVKAGENVSQGQQIAKSGNTGRSTGPHLHWEVIDSATGQKLRPPRF